MIWTPKTRQLLIDSMDLRLHQIKSNNVWSSNEKSPWWMELELSSGLLLEVASLCRQLEFFRTPCELLVFNCVKDASHCIIFIYRTEVCLYYEVFFCYKTFQSTTFKWAAFFFALQQTAIVRFQSTHQTQMFWFYWLYNFTITFSKLTYVSQFLFAFMPCPYITQHVLMHGDRKQRDSNQPTIKEMCMKWQFNCIVKIFETLWQSYISIIRMIKLIFFRNSLFYTFLLMWYHMAYVLLLVEALPHHE